MNRWEKDILETFLSDEERELKELKAIYKQALKDIDDNIARLMGRDDATMQHVIYQKEYQAALRKQVSGILDELNSKQFRSISEYTAECYNKGFTSVAYSMHKQGIPIITPIDEMQVIKAMRTDSKLSGTLYEALGEDVSELKKRISSNLSRGIATGQSYQDIARNIAAESNIGMNNAMRIARTEGGRIRNQAAYDAAVKAKEKGAEVLLQWDASLDGNTRDSHKRVDGEIVEVGERFSNGLLFPCDPAGAASEVINCRCAALMRTRWAMDEEELFVLKKRAKAHGLDKTENFEDFTKKFLKAAAEMPLMEVALNAGLATYTKEEIEEMAKQTHEVANNHVANESKWSGNIVIDNSGMLGGKDWNCDIIVQSETAPLILLHEHLHAHSISYYDRATYKKFRAIEEGVVQLMAEEIGKAEGITIVQSSHYTKWVDNLRILNKKLKLGMTDYEFAKELLEMPVAERLDWLEEKAYNLMQSGGTVDQFREINDLIEELR